MAKYKIIDQEKGLKIEVKDIEGQEQQRLGEFQKCQEGQCSCPTDEYKKLDSMEVEQKDGGIEIKLKAKEDQILDKEEIFVEKPYSNPEDCMKQDTSLPSTQIHNNIING